MMRGLSIFFMLVFSSVAFAADKVQEVVTPKGFKAWMVEEHSLPLVAVKVVFKDSGVAYDISGKEGRAAMTAAMLMEGAGDMDSHAFNEALENKAIQLNFAVDEDLFRGSVESLSENREKAFSYLAMALTRPRFDSSAMDRVKSQNLTLIKQQEEDPGYLLQRAWENAAFPSHPYSNLTLGTQSSVDKMSADDLRDFARRYLTRENVVISAVGDITPQELSRLIDTYLSDLPEKYNPDVKVAEVQLPAEAMQKTVEFDIPQTKITFGTQGLKREDPDYYAAYVMNQILGGNGSLTSLLGEEIRQKRGLAYAVFSQLDPMMHAGAWRGSFSTRNEKVGTAIEVLNDTLKDFAQDGPTDQQVADAKTYLTGSFVLGLDSNGDIANYLISMQINKLGKDYLATRNQKIEAVTKDQIAAIARKLADPKRLIVVMVGKPETKP